MILFETRESNVATVMTYCFFARGYKNCLSPAKHLGNSVNPMPAQP
jgi:hypothetical protein